MTNITNIIIILFPALSVSICLSFNLPNMFPKVANTTIEFIGVYSIFITVSVSLNAPSLLTTIPLVAKLQTTAVNAYIASVPYNYIYNSFGWFI